MLAGGQEEFPLSSSVLRFKIVKRMNMSESSGLRNFQFFEAVADLISLATIFCIKILVLDIHTLVF